VRWVLRQPEPAAVSRLERELDVLPPLARLLVLRGLADPEAAARFLRPALSQLHSPYQMLGMTAAVERLQAAIAGKEPVLIYGDYDVDGTTAVVILKTAIELLGGAADSHVPHRIREGYGMKDDVIEHAAAAGVRLIISVDTGIRAFQAAETARRLGVDLIVTDHHLPAAGEGVPPALAVLNPNQAGCDYPCKALCGAGVAFKLAQALLEKAGRERLLPSFLKMVAIATIADAVPLTGENRVFARLGLEGLRSPVNAGLKALLQAAQLEGTRPLTSTDVAFRLAPRLNAAGRMDVARDVIELFTVRDAVRAGEIAARLNQLNAERQQEEARILAEVHAQLDSDAALREAFCIVVDGDRWHRGVIGIAATRVVERFGRPALVLAREESEAYGSGRSIPAFHLLEALESCHQLFTRFGGHAHAVGFSLPVERVAELRQALDSYARARLTLADFEPVLNLDAELSLDQVTPQFYDALRQLAPFGMENPEPVFAARNLRLALPPRILKEKHLKLKVAAAPNSRALDALGWRMAERLANDALVPGDRLDLAFILEENTHPDFGGLQLVLRDFARAGQRAASSE
jgi:single-stranded-DNA-specific exonuclease